MLGPKPESFTYPKAVEQCHAHRELVTARGVVQNSEQFLGIREHLVLPLWLPSSGANVHRIVFEVAVLYTEFENGLQFAVRAFVPVCGGGMVFDYTTPPTSNGLCIYFVHRELS
ncbi:hypothetical protein [Corynebacterium sp. HMSC078H07]|uniref:hypothetical protein n=1 Tax=Corynebacterium sp. HMSC078H07 TaxID=1739379 RepID=UPI001FEED7C2|nr:hypothetical protein [Corynebacterium sp. HMSC078H07]